MGSHIHRHMTCINTLIGGWDHTYTGQQSEMQHQSKTTDNICIGQQSEMQHQSKTTDNISLGPQSEMQHQSKTTDKKQL